MQTPKELFYTRSHEWVRFPDETTAVVGLTDFAQDSLGDLVFINLPENGDAVVADKSFADVESVKAVSDVMSPVSGTVSAVNDDLADSPETINEDPYGAWLVEVSDVTDRAELLSAEEYEAFCAAEA